MDPFETNSSDNIFENTTTFFTSENTISLESKRTNPTTISMITLQPSRNTTQKSKMDSNTFYVLLGAITFVFVTTFICITLCTIYMKRKKNKQRQRIKDNESYDSNINSAFDVSKSKSVKHLESVNIHSKKIVSLQNFQKDQKVTVGKQPDTTSEDSGGGTTVTRNSWPTTFSALSGSKSESSAQSPNRKKFAKYSKFSKFKHSKYSKSNRSKKQFTKISLKPTQNVD